MLHADSSRWNTAYHSQAQEYPARRVFTMSSRTLDRLSAISLLIGSLLLIIGSIIGFFTGNDRTSTIFTTSSLILLIGAMLVALGLPGMYTRQAGRIGVLGLIGFACTFFFILIGITEASIHAFIFPLLAAHGLLSGLLPLGALIFDGIGFLLGLIGGILLGVAIMRTAVLPRWAGVFLIVGGFFDIGFALGLDPLGAVGLLLFAVGLAWLAVGMWSQQPNMVEAALPTSEVRV
jgi:hypothetical protein